MDHNFQEIQKSYEEFKKMRLNQTGPQVKKRIGMTPGLDSWKDIYDQEVSLT